MTYTVEQHVHVFSAWAASRAAAVKGARFQVLEGRRWIEEADLYDACRHWRDIPRQPTDFDQWHKEKRQHIINVSDLPERSDGLAAKLINVYMKSCFFSVGIAEEPLVDLRRVMHPPIDRLLLSALGDKKRPEMLRQPWVKRRGMAWSQLSCAAYQEIINDLRQEFDPIWMCEALWAGGQANRS